MVKTVQILRRFQLQLSPDQYTLYTTEVPAYRFQEPMIWGLSFGHLKTEHVTKARIYTKVNETGESRCTFMATRRFIVYIDSRTLFMEYRIRDPGLA